jgi:beta-phosphoglucomutase-like phosphatase (HAD superfamily)
MRAHPAISDGIEAVILDFDGTLADTTPSHEQALRAALQPHGLGLDPVPHGKPLAVDDAPVGVTAARAADMHVLTVAGGHLVLPDGDGKGSGHSGSRARGEA